MKTVLNISPEKKQQRLSAKMRCCTLRESIQYGIPPRHASAHLVDFDFDVDMMSEDGLFITGPVGTGKTHLLSAIANYCLDEFLAGLGCYHNSSDGSVPYPNQPIFTTFPEFLFEIKRSYNKESTGPSEDEIIKKYSECEILLLDDLGAEKATEWSSQILFLLMDRRYSNIKKTYISSNLSLKEISNHIDDRIASRISQMCDVKKLTGKDRRMERELK